MGELFMGELFEKSSPAPLQKPLPLGSQKFASFWRQINSAEFICQAQSTKRRKESELSFGAFGLCALTFLRTRAKKLKMTTDIIGRKFLGVWGILSRTPHISFSPTFASNKKSSPKGG